MLCFGFIGSGGRDDPENMYDVDDVVAYLIYLVPVHESLPQLRLPSITGVYQAYYSGRCCCLYIQPLFLPNDIISTPRVGADSS